MPNLTVKVTQNRFQELGRRILRAGESGLEELANGIAEDAKERVNTVEDRAALYAGERTGETAEQITVTQEGPRNFIVESKAPWSAPLEFGHVQHPGQLVMGPGGAFRLVRDWVAAKPFFTPAVEAAQAKAKKIFATLKIGV